MAFRFPLQALLRLRRSYERRERLRLEIITRRRLHTQQQIDELKSEILEANDRLARTLQAGMPAVELHLEVAQANARAKRQEVLAEQLAKLTQEHRAQQVAYQHAQQQRQIIENLRARLFAIYQQVQARREQQQLDDLFLIRREVGLPR